MKPEHENEARKLGAVALCIAAGTLVLFWLSSKSRAIKNMPSDSNQNKTIEEGCIIEQTQPTHEPYDNLTIESPDKPESKWYKSIEPYRFCVEVVTLAFFLWYVDLTYWQTKSSTEQLTAFKQSITDDRRAWLFMDGDLTMAPSEKNDYGIFSGYIKNIGKSPALDIQTFAKAVDNSNSIPKLDDAIPTSMTMGYIAPGQRMNIYMPPIPVGFITNINTGRPVYLYGTCWYNDVFRKHHWFQFAFSVGHDPLQPKGMFIIRQLGMHDSCDDAESHQPTGGSPNPN